MSPFSSLCLVGFALFAIACNDSLWSFRVKQFAKQPLAADRFWLRNALSRRLVQWTPGIGNLSGPILIFFQSALVSRGPTVVQMTPTLLNGNSNWILDSQVRPWERCLDCTGMLSQSDNYFTDWKFIKATLGRKNISFSSAVYINKYSFKFCFSVDLITGFSSLVNWFTRGWCGPWQVHYEDEVLPNLFRTDPYTWRTGLERNRSSRRFGNYCLLLSNPSSNLVDSIVLVSSASVCWRY